MRLESLEEEIGRAVDMTTHRGAQFKERAVFELADALFRDAEFAAELFERRPLVAQATLGDDDPLARIQLTQRLGEPTRARLAVTQPNDDVLGIGPVVGEEILPIVF